MAIASPREQPAATPAPLFLGPIHEGIPVKNAEASLKFYTEVLGLKVLPRPELPAPGYWLGDENNTVQFHLIVGQDYRPGPDARISPTGRHTAWLVKDIDALRRRLTELGIHFDQLTGLVGSDQVFIKDPDGHIWEFQGPRA